ncbi:MAG: Ig-like domain-containing protein [Bacilli bacterium]
MKKIKTLIIAIILAFILTGCLGPVIIKIAPEKAMIELEVGDFVRVEFDSNHTGPFEFITSDEDIFTVEDGIIYGVSVGLAFLTIEAKETPSNIEAKANIAIKVVEATSSIDEEDVETEVKEITIIGNQNLKVGESEIFRANYGDSTYLNDDIIWMSQNSEVASIDANGILTANQAGTTTIIVIIDNQTATIVVNVRTDGAVVVKPTSLIINGSSFVNVSDSVILTVTPNQGNITGITWTSSDNSKATVNEFGIVTGVATGIVTITATLTDDTSVSNTFTLVVKESETSASPITSINLSGANEVLQGNKIKLNVTYTPANEPATFTYASSNTSVAIVDAAGWVTGVSGGVVQITASLVGDPEKKANFTVTVIPLPTGITISGASTVSYGQNIILTATAIPTGATNIVTWTSSDSTVVTIDVNGRVTGMKVGTATITATSIVSASIKATHQVTVTDQMSITLNPTSLNLVAGSNQTLTATVVAASLTDKSVSWSSSNTSVATVDSNGKVTAVAAGSANIIAKLNANNSIQAQASVTVTAPSLPTISLSNNTLSLVVGDTKTLTATVGNTSNTSVTWSSSATSIATVDSNGKVTAVKAGTATITATSVADTSVKATCAVTVTAPPTTGLTVTADPSATIQVGASGYQLYVKDSSGTNVSRLECTFTPSDATIATVSQYGTISALKAGTVTINVTHATKGAGTITLTITSGGGSTPPGELVNPSFTWVGHRGCNGPFVSNTREAFLEGIARGYKALECDIRVTKDNQFVIFHNSYLNDSSGERVLTEPKSESTPESKTLAQLQAMTVTQTRSTSYPPAGTYTGKIMSLGDYLDLCKQHKVIAVIEIKWTTGLNTNDTSKTGALVEFVKSKGWYQNTVFMTSMRAVLDAIRASYSDATLQWLCGSTDSYNSYKSWALSKNISLDIAYGALTQAMVTEFHNKGLKVNSYTLNTAATAVTQIGYGIDMITTDYLYHSGSTVVKKYA